MPLGLNRRDLNATGINYRLGTPVTLPKNFGNIFPKLGTITAVSYANPVLTVTANNDFVVDDNVAFAGLTTNATLNGRIASITFASPTQFKVSIAGLTITNGADTGTATKGKNNFIPSGGSEVNAVTLPKNFGNVMNIAGGN